MVVPGQPGPTWNFYGLCMLLITASVICLAVVAALTYVNH